MGCTASYVAPEAGNCCSAGRASSDSRGLQSATCTSPSAHGEPPSPTGTSRQWISATMWHWDTASFDHKEGSASASVRCGDSGRESDRSRASSVVLSDDKALGLPPISVEARPLPPCVAQFQEDQVLRGAVLKLSPHKAPLPPPLDEVDAATTSHAEGLHGRFSPDTTGSQDTYYFGDMLPWHSAPRRWSAHATTWSGEHAPDLNSVCRPEPVEFMAAPPQFPSASVRSMDVVASSTPRW